MWLISCRSTKASIVPFPSLLSEPPEALPKAEAIRSEMNRMVWIKSIRPVATRSPAAVEGSSCRNSALQFSFHRLHAVKIVSGNSTLQLPPASARMLVEDTAANRKTFIYDRDYWRKGTGTETVSWTTRSPWFARAANCWQVRLARAQVKKAERSDRLRQGFCCSRCESSLSVCNSSQTLLFLDLTYKYFKV